MTSNNDLALTLQAHLLSIPSQDIAEALELDASGVSRIRSGERGLRVGEFAIVMALPSPHFPAGLHIQPANSLAVAPDEYQALLTLARKSLGCGGGA
nr:hypothetical protein [uncultured Cardiobacterium sp.]